MVEGHVRRRADHGERGGVEGSRSIDGAQGVACKYHVLFAISLGQSEGLKVGFSAALASQAGILGAVGEHIVVGRLFRDGGRCFDGASL